MQSVCQHSQPHQEDHIVKIKPVDITPEAKCLSDRTKSTLIGKRMRPVYQNKSVCLDDHSMTISTPRSKTAPSTTDKVPGKIPQMNLLHLMPMRPFPLGESNPDIRSLPMHSLRRASIDAAKSRQELDSVLSVRLHPTTSTSPREHSRVTELLLSGEGLTLQEGAPGPLSSETQAIRLSREASMLGMIEQRSAGAATGC